MLYHHLDQLAGFNFREETIGLAKDNGYSAISEAIIKGYVLDRLPCPKISVMLNRSDRMWAAYWLKKFSISMRPPGGNNGRNPARIMAKMKQMSASELAGLTGNHGAARFGCHRAYFYTLRRRVLEGGI